jgi:hypothetical protein
MKAHWTFAGLMVLALLAGCGKKEEPTKEEAKAEGDGITLTTEQSEAMGLVTGKLQAANYRGELAGYGVVSAFDAVAQSDADTATATAAAAQSSAAAARARELSTGADAPVSRETYEAAASKSAADQAALLLARRKGDAAFGIAAPWRGGNRGAILARLQTGRSVLIHVTFPIGAGAGITAQRFRVSRMGGNGKSWLTSSVWAAPADPTVPGRSFFGLVDGSDLAQGERVIASIPTGAPQAGVIVPAAALLLGESDSWVYLKTGEETYLRARIDTSRPMEGGYFVSGGGFSGGQNVVTQGAGLLYAHEINPSTEPEE